MLFYLIVFTTIIAIVICSCLGVYVAKYFRLPVAKLFITLMLLYCFWAFCSLSILIAPTFEDKIFFARIKYLGVCFIAPVSLLFVLSILEKNKFLNKYIKLALFPIPIVTAISPLFEKLRNYVNYDFTLFSKYSITSIKFSDGPILKLYLDFTYILVFTMLIILMYEIYSTRGEKRQKALLILFGCFATPIIDFIGNFFYFPTRWLQIPSALIFITGISLAIALFKFKILDIVGLAKNKIFEKIPAAIWVINSQGFLMMFNERAKEITMLTAKNIGKSIEECLSNSPELFKAFKERNYSSIKIVKNNKTEYFDLKYETLKIAAENSGSIFMAYDTTFRVLMEQKILENNNELENLNDKISQKQRFQNKLLSLLANDITGNFKEMKWALKLNDNRILSQDMETTSILLKNMVWWTQLQGDEFKPQSKPFDIRGTVFDVFSQISNITNSKHINLQFVNQNNPIIIVGDTEIIASVLSNILLNIVRLSKKDESIIVQTFVVNEKLQITIKDKNIEFAENFQKTNELSANLKLISEIINAIHGDFDVKSNTESGNEFTITLPITS